MSALKKVALVTDTWPPEINGVAMTLARLAHGLAERGVAVQIIRPRQAQSAGIATPGLSHVLMPSLPLPGYAGLRVGLPWTQRLRRQWIRQRPDVVHIATEGVLGWAALSVANDLGVPVTSSFHTHFHQYCQHYGLAWLQSGVSVYLRALHNRTRCILVPNADCAEALRAQGYQNTAVLGRGIDTDLFNPSKRSDTLRRLWGVRETSLVALYVGRLAAEKNLDAVAAAFAALKQQAPDACMVWVGDGPERARLMRRWPEHLFVGAKSGEALARHYASADVFLFASLSETFGNVVLEAMASGLAVLAYRTAAAAQYIEHGRNGLTVAPDAHNAAQQFKTWAATLASNPSWRRQLGHRARVDMRSLSWDSVVERFADCLAAAAHNASAQPVAVLRISEALT